MTWFEFKSKVDEYLAENSLDPQEIEIWYFDFFEGVKVEQMDVHTERMNGNGKIRLWVD